MALSTQHSRWLAHPARIILASAWVVALSLGSACTRDVRVDSEKNGPSAKPDESGEAPASEGEKEEDAITCRGEAFHCAAPAPKGWFGPMQLQKMKKGEDAVKCDSALPDPIFIPTPHAPLDDDVVQPSFEDNLFVDGISAKDASCSGCEANFQEGSCLPPRWSLRSLDSDSKSGCGKKELQDWGNDVESETCRSHNLFSDPGEGWAMLPARIDVKGKCEPVLDKVVEKIEPVKFGNFYRSCKIESSKKSCGEKDETCLSAKTDKPWMNQVCIGKQGQHQCKTSDYPIKLVSFSDYSDKRGCTECTAGIKDGGESCSTKVYVQFKDEDDCMNKKLVDPSEVCIENFRFDQLKPITSIRESVDYSFDGKCVPNPIKPIGRAAVAKPVTFCCQRPKGFVAP